jgi:hypothetical protein
MRAGLLVVASAAAAGVAAELALIGHWHTPIQAVPWAVLLLEAVAIVGATCTSGPRTAAAIRIFGVVAALAGGWGVVAHLAENAAFVHELHPTWVRGRVLWRALSGGVPSLAPLALALPAILAALATSGRAIRPGSGVRRRT